MRAAPRAADAEVASPVEQFRAKAEEESRRRDAFDREWDRRVASFRKRCDAVEGNLRKRHASALEKTRASLEARLVSKPKRHTSELEALLRKREGLMRRRRFGEALDVLKQSEAREKLELEDHKRRVRGENVELLDALFQTQREELAVFARERDAEETRINAARADAAARAAKRGFRDYEPRRVAGDERLPGSNDDGADAADAAEDAEDDEDGEDDEGEGDEGEGDAERAAAGKTSRVSRVPPTRWRDANARAEIERGADDDVFNATKTTSPRRTDLEPANGVSAPASPASVSRFYADVGGVADIMRLDTSSNVAASANRGAAVVAARAGTATRAREARAGRLEPRARPAPSGPAPTHASPPRGLTGAEARAAADRLVAAAMRMTRVDAEDALPGSAAELGARADAPAAARACDARRSELKDDGDDAIGRPIRVDGGVLSDSDADSSVCSEELDDVYLASPPRARLADVGAREGVGLALGALAGAFKSEPGPFAPRGLGAVVGGQGTSAVPRDARLALTTHRARGGEAEASRDAPGAAPRAPAAARVADDAADPRRDFPAGGVARGAALLRRMPGPDDCYRSRRLGPPGGANVWAGELGFPNRDEGTRRRLAASPERRSSATVRERDATVLEADGPVGTVVRGDAGGKTSRETPRLSSPERASPRGGEPRRSVTKGASAARPDATEERDRNQSAAVAAARAAAFKYGATVAPAVGAFGQPIRSPRATTTDTNRGNAESGADGASAPRDPLRSPPRRRATPLGHDVDPVTSLKLSDTQMARASERDGLHRGEVLANANANANDPSAPERPVSFRDPAALPEPPTSRDVALLFRHCRKGEYELCRDAFKRRGIDPNVRDAHGNTPLIAACQSGAGRVAKLCVRRGADVNGVNAKKNSALHFAATFGFDALARWLVENGADTHAVNEDGKTPFEGL